MADGSENNGPGVVEVLTTALANAKADRQMLLSHLLDAHMALGAMMGHYVDHMIQHPACREEEHPCSKDEYDVEDDLTLDRLVSDASDSEIFREYAGSFDEGHLMSFGWSYDYDRDVIVWTNPHPCDDPEDEDRTFELGPRLVSQSEGSVASGASS